MSNTQLQLLDHFGRRLLMAGAVALAIGCGGSDGAPEANPASAGYLGSVSIELPGSEWSSYTAIVQEVDDATDASLRAGLETPEWVAPKAYHGAICIPSHSEASLTRYTTDGGGHLTKEATVSFLDYGIGHVEPVFIAPDKAYVFDDAGGQIVIFDPTAMELTGETIDVSDLLAGPAADYAGYLPATLANFSRQRDGRLFVPVRWANWDSEERFVPLAGLLIVDTARDAPVKLLTDGRLTDSIYTVMTDSGDIYLFTGAIGVAFQHVLGNARPGGALRVRSGQEEFDPDFYVDLDEAVGGRPASTPVWSSGTSVLLKVYHDEQQPITEEIKANPIGMLSQAAWRYWEIDLEGGHPPREIQGIPWTSTDGFFYDLRASGGPLFIGVMAADFGRTTLYEVKPDGFERSIDVTGVLQTLVPFTPGRE